MHALVFNPLPTPTTIRCGPSVQTPVKPTRRVPKKIKKQKKEETQHELVKQRLESRPDWQTRRRTPRRRRCAVTRLLSSRPSCRRSSFRPSVGELNLRFLRLSSHLVVDLVLLLLRESFILFNRLFVRWHVPPRCFALAISESRNPNEHDDQERSE